MSLLINSKHGKILVVVVVLGDPEQKRAKEKSGEARPLLAFRDPKRYEKPHLWRENMETESVTQVTSAMYTMLSSSACYLDMGSEIAIILSL